MPFPPYHLRLSVPFDYPVHFTRHLFHGDNPLLAATLNRHGEDRRHKALVYIDSGVAGAHPALAMQINEYFHARPDSLELSAPPQVIPGGEEAKRSWDAVRDAMWTMGNLHLDRQSYVVAIGGGAVLDMVGFAASIVHRGLRLVRVPTTTLAQADAGIGVKNGMDEHGQKNFVGTFAPPMAVLNDFAFLLTLPFEHWIGGIAEAFKVAIVKDVSFFRVLREKAGALRERDAGAMEEAVHRCAMLHLDHIRSGGDPFEMGSARPLDFGHWAAHRIESMSRYSVGHGQAVSLGIALDSVLASRRGLIGEAELEEVLGALLECGLPIHSPHLASRDREGRLLVLEGIDQFREHLGGRLTITLPHGMGNRIEVHEVDPSAVVDAIGLLEERSRKKPA